MTDNERFQEIERLYHQALEQEVGQRSAFLKGACGDDESVLQEVESLLAREEQAANFIEGPALDMALDHGMMNSEVPSLVGRRLGPYDILGLLGAGGMGEVYRARDTRLKRTVAVKVLPSSLARDPERRKRFEREAQAVSSLNHPHICTLHDIGQQDGIDFLVMEYLEGETLAARLKKGALPLAKVLTYGIEIANALDQAHRHAVIHRDLKPGNIMLTKAGSKVLDFGLARVGAGLKPAQAETQALTEEGAILGTLQYMAPEQLEGKEADARTDIFAFGAVVYEMATGKKAFAGDSRASVMAAILEHQPPPISSFQSLTPLALDQVVRTCMAKDPDARQQNAHDVMLALQWIAEEGSQSVSTLTPRRQVLPWAVAGILAVITLFGYWKPWRAPAIVTDRPFAQLDLDLGPDEFWEPAISRDGTRIVFVSKQGLAIRRLDQSKITPLTGTEGAYLPFFSPNGQWVAFFAGGKLQKVAIDGGAPITLCDTAHPAGGSWIDDDNIVAALDISRGLSRIPAAGGTPQPLTDSKSDPLGIIEHRYPQTLPGGKGVLFIATNARSQSLLRVLTLNDGKLRTVVENSSYGRYLPSGYLVYYQREMLFAAPMDADRLELTGPAVPLVYAVSNPEDRVFFDLSPSGTLVYRRATPRNTVPSWLYSSGKIEPAFAMPRNYRSARLSPDGTRLALSVIHEGKQSLWLHDLTRGTLNRLTSEDDPESFPTWTPDGEFLAFRSGNTLAWMQSDSDGGGKVERLAGVSRNAAPWSFSADGKWLAFWPLEPDSDLWIVPVERAPGVLRLGQPQPLLQQAGAQGAPAISPDGRWLAYTSAASGRFDIYVMPFSPRKRITGPKWPVSNGGGHSPIWSHKGQELFYQSLDDRRVRVAAYTVKGDSFVPEKPRLWSEKQMADNGDAFGPPFDVAPDGKRILILAPAEEAKPETILHVLLNVDGELRRRAPSHRK